MRPIMRHAMQRCRYPRQAALRWPKADPRTLPGRRAPSGRQDPPTASRYLIARANACLTGGGISTPGSFRDSCRVFLCASCHRPGVRYNSPLDIFPVWRQGIASLTTLAAEPSHPNGGRNHLMPTLHPPIRLRLSASRAQPSRHPRRARPAQPMVKCPWTNAVRDA